MTGIYRHALTGSSGAVKFKLANECASQSALGAIFARPGAFQVVVRNVPSRNSCAVGANLTEGRMSRFRARAFTLMEVLVVVGILAVLATLTVPLVGRLRESARRAEDLSHLRQLAAATLLYAGDNDGALPPGRMTSPRPTPTTTPGSATRTAGSPCSTASPPSRPSPSCPASAPGTTASKSSASRTSTPNTPTTPRRLDLLGRPRRPDRRRGRQVPQPAPHPRPLHPRLQHPLDLLVLGRQRHRRPLDRPHVGSRYVEYPPGVPLKPTPDGLGVVLTDGSASFVPWPEMIIMKASPRRTSGFWRSLYALPGPACA